MYNVHIDIPDWEIIEKSLFLGPRPGHLYISRKRVGGEWVYTYRDSKVSGAHGNHRLHDDDHHSIDAHAESHRFAHSPEKGYQYAAWVHAVNTLHATDERQSLRDASGKSALEIGPMKGKTYRYFAFQEGMKKRKPFRGIEELRSWVAKQAHPPTIVLDVHGRHHHTLVPVASQRSRKAERGGWMTANFEEDHPNNPYKETGKTKYTFRSRESYEKWWAEQNQAMLGKRETAAVEVSEQAMETRPMTSLLETGMIPVKVTYKHKTGKQRLDPHWELDFKAVGVTGREFNKQFVNEHWGMITAAVSSAIRQYFPLAKEQKKWNDLFNEMSAQAATGVLECAHRYNPSKGYKFTSFARTWIDHQLLTYAKKRISASAHESGEISPSMQSPEDLDHTTAIAFQRAWWKAQNSKFRELISKLDSSSPSGLSTLAKYSEFLDLEGASYAKTQDWVAHNMGHDWTIPIDEPSSYITSMKERREIMGAAAPATTAEKKEYRKVWRRLVNRYFTRKKKKAESEDQAGYYGLAQKIVLKMLPKGDVQNPDHSFIELGDLFRKELEVQFGNPKRPMLTAVQRINHVQQIFKRELPKMASTKAIQESLSESPYSVRHRREYTKQMQTALTKALVVMFIDQTRAYILNKSERVLETGPGYKVPEGASRSIGDTDSGKPVFMAPHTPESFQEHHKEWTAKDHDDAHQQHVYAKNRARKMGNEGERSYHWHMANAHYHDWFLKYRKNDLERDRHFDTANYKDSRDDHVRIAAAEFRGQSTPSHERFGMLETRKSLGKSERVLETGPGYKVPEGAHSMIGKTRNDKPIWDAEFTPHSFLEHHKDWNDEDHQDARRATTSSSRGKRTIQEVFRLHRLKNAHSAAEEFKETEAARRRQQYSAVSESHPEYPQTHRKTDGEVRAMNRLHRAVRARPAWDGPDKDHVKNFASQHENWNANDHHEADLMHRELSHGDASGYHTHMSHAHHVAVNIVVDRKSLRPHSRGMPDLRRHLKNASEAAQVEKSLNKSEHADPNIFWHGSPSGDLRGGAYGLHLGTRRAAEESLHARIGHPVSGSWDGTREYGKTKLAGKKTLRERGVFPTGYNNEAPEEDHYPTGKAKYGDDTSVLSSAKPSITSHRLTGLMTNSQRTPHDDFKANGYMAGQIKRGTAKRGYYYRNVSEDEGSVSVVVPSSSHLEKVKSSLSKAMQGSLFGPPPKKVLGYTESGKPVIDVPHERNLDEFREQHQGWTSMEHIQGGIVHDNLARKLRKRAWADLGEYATNGEHMEHPMTVKSGYHQHMASAHFKAASAKINCTSDSPVKFALGDANHWRAKQMTKAMQGTLFSEPKPEGRHLGSTKSGKPVLMHAFTPESFKKFHKNWSRDDYRDANRIHADETHRLFVASGEDPRHTPLSKYHHSMQGVYYEAALKRSWQTAGARNSREQAVKVGRERFVRFHGRSPESFQGSSEKLMETAKNSLETHQQSSK